MLPFLTIRTSANFVFLNLKLTSIIGGFMVRPGSIMTTSLIPTHTCDEIDYNRVVPTVRDDYCARPDCEHPNFLGAGEYFIQRVIGRQPHISDDSDGPSEFLWLVKWDE